MTITIQGWPITSSFPRSKRNPGRPKWKCVQDPSEGGPFRGNLFTMATLMAGGFDDGTEFVNTRTGERRAWKGERLVAAEKAVRQQLPGG